MAGDNKVGVLPLFFCWALTAVAFVAKALSTAATVPLILDTDDAMRLTMVHDFLGGQGWFDLVQHRLNTPYGALMHWSRLIDLPEASLLFLLRPAFGAAADIALVYAWPLLLLVPLLWLTARLALRLGGRAALWPGLLLSSLSLITLVEFAPGRLDHHAVQILLALAMLWCAVVALERPRFALGAGVAAGATLTIGIESLPVVGATIMAFGLAWVATARQSVALRDFGLSFALSTLLGLAQGVPPGRWLVPAADAISGTYALAAILCGLAFLVLSLLPLRTVPTRLSAGLVAGAIAVALVVLSFPAILAGPYGQMDPWLLANWVDRISEAEPLWTSFASGPVYVVAVAVPVVTGLAVVAWNIVRRPQERGAWLVYGLVLTIAFVVMLLQIRAARFAVPLAAPACAALIGATWHRMVRTNGFGPILAMLGSVAASAGLIVAVFGTLVVAAFPAYDAGTLDPNRPGRQSCLMPAAFADLAGLPPERIMTPIDLGSHMLLYTPHAVVAAPYHRNEQGVLDTFRFFNGPIEEGRAILRARGIALVAICPAMSEVRGLVAHTADSFVSLFAAGTLPGWLREMSAAGAPLKVYSVEP